MTEIIENLLPDESISNLESLLLSNDFPWYFNKSVIEKTAPKESFMRNDSTMESNQFTHIFFSDGNICSSFFEKIFPIVNLLGMYKQKEFSSRLIRVKANLLTKNESFPVDCHNFPHTDSSSVPGESLLYYVNDSDGDTFIFNEKRGTEFNKLTLNKRITPKMGKSVFFDSDYYHASSCPKKTDVRVVINFLFNK